MNKKLFIQLLVVSVFTGTEITKGMDSVISSGGTKTKAAISRVPAQTNMAIAKTSNMVTVESLHDNSSDENSKMMRIRNRHQNNNTMMQSHPARHGRIMKPNYPMHLSIVADDQGNVIGAYKMTGKTKEGYHYGSFYTNLNQIPVSVIESGHGTPAHLSVPGATSNVVGYLNNPHYNGSMGSPKRIMLCQYNMPMETIRPMDQDSQGIIPMETIRPMNPDMQEAVPTLMPYYNDDVQVQAYNEKKRSERREDNQEKREKRREEKREKRNK